MDKLIVTYYLVVILYRASIRTEGRAEFSISGVEAKFVTVWNTCSVSVCTPCIAYVVLHS